jgi:hypothetical protein
MEAKQIAGMGRRLNLFLALFRDCFVRSEPREHLKEYVHGQVAKLDRKSIEPIALEVGTRPRTLQGFLEFAKWDKVQMRDRLQQLVARDHADPHAIGTIDESGHAKKGKYTAGVRRQWCGRLGKVENCVVSVHVGRGPCASPQGSHSRRGGLPQEDGHRSGSGASGPGQWDPGVGVDLRRVVRPGPGVPERHGGPGPGLRGGSAVEVRGVVEGAPRALQAKAPGPAPKGQAKAISASGPSDPPRLRSTRPGDLFTSLPAADHGSGFASRTARRGPSSGRRSMPLATSPGLMGPAPPTPSSSPAT